MSKLKVELITYTPDADKIVAAAAKLCYAKSDIDTLLEGLTPEKTENFLELLSSLGHQSPVEHASFPRASCAAYAPQNRFLLRTEPALCFKMQF